MSRILCIACSLLLAPVLLGAPPKPGERVTPSGRLDAIVAKNLKAQGLKPNPLASDEVFLRRIYLDIIGRVPTKKEALRFLNDEAKNKRTVLVDELLASEGYVHHFYSFWADLLRAKTQISGAGNSTAAGYAYHDWIKNSLRENRPYDEMVYDLLTASGSSWENGAVGYYLRDYGMPLDNLAITTQVFLGTQIVCAQCHDHPFDTWTQMDYYHLSAFTYGMMTTNQAENARDAQQLFSKTAKPDPEERREFSRAMSEILKPVRFNNVWETPRKLRLPHDYQYSNAKPRSLVTPRVPWGDQPMSSRNDVPIHEFAAWVTSPDNPRFTRVMANRLWKKAMGRGVFEPVDDLREQTTIPFPELMAYLERRLVSVDYDMKKFLRTIYLSKTYQREASPDEVMPWVPYHFPGPVLRRLSSEQIWDSLVAMVIENSDRPSAAAELRRERLQTRTEWIANGIYDHEPEKMMEFALQVSSKQKELSAEIQKAQEKVAAARETENTVQIREALQEVALLRGELAEMVAHTVYKTGLQEKVDQTQAGIAEAEDDEFLQELALVVEDGVLVDPETAMESRSNGFDGGLYINGLLNQVFSPKLAQLKRSEAQRQKQEIKAWGVTGPKSREHYKSFERQRKAMVRASELPSPAPNGHFLREFGQSDRELVDNANDQASITQALSLLNGKINHALLHGYSQLSRDLRDDAHAGQRLDTIFLTMLSRKATPEERELLIPVLKQDDGDGIRQTIWAVLNTRQFLFVQ